MAQVFVNNQHFSRIKPMNRKSQAGDELSWFVQSFGIPARLLVDNAKEQNLGKWNFFVKEYLTNQAQIEPYSPWQNRAEQEIEELKKHVDRICLRQNVPVKIWDFIMKYCSDLRTLIAHDISSMDGRTVQENATGNTSDISEYIDYTMYEPVFYKKTRKLIGCKKKNRKMVR